MTSFWAHLVIAFGAIAFTMDRDLIVVTLDGWHPPSLRPRTSHCGGVLDGVVVQGVWRDHHWLWGHHGLFQTRPVVVQASGWRILIVVI